MKNKIFIMFLLLIMPFVVVNGAENDILVSPVLYDESEGSDFVIGNSTVSDDNINGILFALGNNVVVNGYNEYGIYAGNNVLINSSVNKDLFAGGNIVEISKTANISRDVYIAGSTVKISGSIGGDLILYGSEVKLSDVYINGKVYINSENITIGDNVTVNGALSYNVNAKVEGSLAVFSKVVTYKPNNQIEKEKSVENIIPDVITSTVSIIIVALVLNALFPKIYKSLDRKISVNKVFTNMGIGFIIFIGLPIASIIALVSVVGVGIGLLALAIYIIGLCLAIIPPMIITGELILTKLLKLKNNFYLSVLIGVTVVKLITLIPSIGSAICFLLMLIGLGYIKELMFPKKA